jgi:hypothetical protein
MQNAECRMQNGEETLRRSMLLSSAVIYVLHSAFASL